MRRRLLAETGLVLALTVALLIVGTALYLLLTEVSVPPTLIPLLFVESLGWRPVVWAVAVIVVPALLRDSPWRHRMYWSIGAASVALTVVLLFPSVQYLTSSGGVAFAVVPWFFSLAGLLVCSFLGWILAIRILDTPAGHRAALVLPVVTATLLVASGVGILALVRQWFELYFTIWGGPPTSYPEFGPDAERYLITAALTIAASAAAIVLAVIRRARGVVVVGVLLLLSGLLTAFVFQVPTGRFWPKPATYELPSDYTPCYGGPNDPGCEGG